MSADWIAQRDDEDYVDFLTRIGEEYTTNPPPAPPGFILIDCDASPRHWPTYTIDDGHLYPAPCLYCAYDGMAKAHAGCEHSHHGRWRRWRVVKWLVLQSGLAGLTGYGTSYTMSAHCDWCLSSLPRWRGKRSYILWVKRETWRCLLRGRHLPGDPIGLGFCSKCLPCPDCGSATAGHRPGCEATQ